MNLKENLNVKQKPTNFDTATQERFIGGSLCAGTVVQFVRNLQLDKYRYPTPQKPEAKKIKSIAEPVQPQKVDYIQHLAPEFNKWGKNIRNVDVDNSIDYLYIRRWLEKQVNIPIDQIAERLNNEAWAVTTYNRRLTYLNIFLTWLVGAGKVDKNPLRDV